MFSSSPILPDSSTRKITSAAPEYWCLRRVVLPTARSTQAAEVHQSKKKKTHTHTSAGQFFFGKEVAEEIAFLLLYPSSGRILLLYIFPGMLTYTAWDSEIESLTSLIKLHQNEQRSAPNGQIGAATQPPVLVTSPTLKKFCVARASEVRWTCTCCHDRAFLIVIAFTTSLSFQSFLCFIGGITHHTSRASLWCSIRVVPGLCL